MIGGLGAATALADRREFALAQPRDRDGARHVVDRPGGLVRPDARPRGLRHVPGGRPGERGRRLRRRPGRRRHAAASAEARRRAAARSAARPRAPRRRRGRPARRHAPGGRHGARRERRRGAGARRRGARRLAGRRPRRLWRQLRRVDRGARLHQGPRRWHARRLQSVDRGGGDHRVQGGHCRHRWVLRSRVRGQRVLARAGSRATARSAGSSRTRQAAAVCGPDGRVGSTTAMDAVAKSCRATSVDGLYDCAGTALAAGA